MSKDELLRLAIHADRLLAPWEKAKYFGTSPPPITDDGDIGRLAREAVTEIRERAHEEANLRTRIDALKFKLDRSERSLAQCRDASQVAAGALRAIMSGYLARGDAEPPEAFLLARDGIAALGRVMPELLL